MHLQIRYILATMRLDELLRDQPGVLAVHGDPAVYITGIASDSRQVIPGALFVAYRGVGTDGHRYIRAAVENGAAAVAGELFDLHDPGVPYVLVPDGRAALAWFSASWYGHPSRKMALVGVTGTDGKTTTSSVLHSILTAAGKRAGLISTVSALVGDLTHDTGLHTTTPDAPDVQRLLAEMRDAGVEATVLEATSHGLAQHRVTGCAFDIAIVTNITHEHLDFHGSYEAYRAAKGMLFQSLLGSPFAADRQKPGWQWLPKTAVLNRDDPSYTYLSQIPAEQVVTYGLAEHRQVAPAAISLSAPDISPSPSGTRFSVAARYPDGREVNVDLTTLLVGRFNVYNILAAAGAALALRVDGESIREGVRRLRGVPGRMERIDRGQNFTAIVDFAHTPNALAMVLQTARELTAPGGRLIAVFGSAGLRDREKRRLMGLEAARHGDYTVITAEDPRTEDLQSIMAETAGAMAEAGKQEGLDFIRIGDRQSAIQHAVQMAQRGDVVIVCGKGHEQSMCFGAIEYPWRDQDALRWALDRLAGEETPPPCVLPTWPGSSVGNRLPRLLRK